MNDSLILNGTHLFLADPNWSHSFDSSSVEFSYQDGNFEILKSIAVESHCLNVSYQLKSLSSSSSSVALAIENGLSPDCRTVMLTGRQALKYWDGTDTSTVFTPGCRGVLNVESRIGLIFDFIDEPNLLTPDEDAFGLEINPRWSFELPPYGAIDVSFRLVCEESASINPKGDTKRHGLIILPNPSWGRVEVLAPFDCTPGSTATIFDIRGRVVRVLKATATNTQARILWDGLNEVGQPVSSGIYVVRMDSGKKHASGKIAILR